MSEAVAATDLGPLQAELRRGSRAVNLVVLSIGLAMLGGCVYLGARHGAEAFAGLFFPALILVIAWWGLRHRVCIHERGIEVFGFAGSKRMRFDEVESLSYRTVLQRVNGIPTGTYVHARLYGGGRGVAFNMRAGKEEEGPLEALRARVSEAIANADLARLQRGESIPWAGGVWLAPDGLRYRPKALLGRKDEVLVPYASGIRHGFGGGSFALLSADSDKPFATMSCDEPNFYSGHLLFLHLTGSRG